MNGSREVQPPEMPSVWNLIREARWVPEWLAGALGRGLGDLPGGDGHGVLLLPGFLASDRSMAPLARVLRNLGYRTYRSGLNPNPGPTAATVNWLRDRVRHVIARADAPISLIGQSLGGIYAREIARRDPLNVRYVITMGSPFRHPDSTRASALAEQLQRWWGPFIDRSRARTLHEPLQVPTTSIYSKSDGIVAWKACLETPGWGRENIEVNTSHIGMSVHPRVIGIVADRLALPVRGWQPYQARHSRPDRA